MFILYFVGASLLGIVAFSLWMQRAVLHELVRSSAEKMSARQLDRAIMFGLARIAIVAGAIIVIFSWPPTLDRIIETFDNWGMLVVLLVVLGPQAFPLAIYLQVRHERAKARTNAVTHFEQSQRT